MKTGKRSLRFACLLTLALCLLATPVLAEETDEGQDPPDCALGSTTTTISASTDPVLDLVTGTTNLLLRVAML
jgi:hypothetical protein